MLPLVETSTHTQCQCVCVCVCQVCVCVCVCDLLGCDCRCTAAIAEEDSRLQLRIANAACRQPAQGRGWVRMARLQLQITDAPCRQPAQEGGWVRMACLQLQIANAACRQPAQGGRSGPNGSFAIADCGCTMQAARTRGRLAKLGPEWPGCKCGLRMHHASSPPKGRVGARTARLQMRIADTPCRQPAQGKGLGRR